MKMTYIECREEVHNLRTYYMGGIEADENRIRDAWERAKDYRYTLGNTLNGDIASLGVRTMVDLLDNKIVIDV